MTYFDDDLPMPFEDEDAIGLATKPALPQSRRLPPWAVILHNDDVNEVNYVVESILALTGLDIDDAVDRTLEAHKAGVAMLLTTHREHAELLEEQFTSKLLTVTIEPAR